MRRFAAAQVNDCGLQILNLSQAAARLAGGFAIAAPAELLEPAIQNAPTTAVLSNSSKYDICQA
jgi:hypothetical protein